MLSRIHATSLRGTGIVVRLGNVAAFEERAPYVNPQDRKNLNRAWGPPIKAGESVVTIALPARGPL